MIYDASTVCYIKNSEQLRSVLIESHIQLQKLICTIQGAASLQQYGCDNFGNYHRCEHSAAMWLASNACAMQYGRGRRHHCLHHTTPSPNQSSCVPCSLHTQVHELIILSSKQIPDRGVQWKRWVFGGKTDSNKNHLHRRNAMSTLVAIFCCLFRHQRSRHVFAPIAI